MKKIDFAQMVTAEDREAADQTARAIEIKAACGARILAVINDAAQKNLTAHIAAGKLNKRQGETYKAGLDWIDMMLGACRAMIANPGADHLDDAAWPAVPDGVAELARAF